MSTDDRRHPRDDETADWPITPPPNTPSGDDGETTQWAGVTPTPPPPQPYPGPPPAPPHGGPPPRPWSAGPTRPSPPTGSAPGWGPHAGYPPHQGFPPPAGRPPLAVGHPRPPGNRTRLLAGAAVAVVIAVVVAVLLTRGGDTSAGRATSTTAIATSMSPTSSRTTAPTPTQVSVDPARLPQMLLGADALGTIVSSPGLVPGDVQTHDDFATDSIVDPPNCTSAWGPGKTWTYQLSGFIGLARQSVAEQPTPNHAVVQAVLAFPDATAAKKSYRDQVTSWGDCQTQTITSHVGGSKDQTAVIGSVAESDGVATVPTTPDLGLPGVTCERALTVAGNVVVDVRSCGPNVADSAGTIARRIATKITEGR